MKNAFVQQLPFKIDIIQETELLFHHGDKLIYERLWRYIIYCIGPIGIFR